MFRDIGNYGGESSDFEGGVIRNGDVVLRRIGATQADVTSGLAGLFVSKATKGFY